MIWKVRKGWFFLYDLQSVFRNIVSMNFIDSCKKDDVVTRRMGREGGMRSRRDVDRRMGGEKNRRRRIQALSSKDHGYSHTVTDTVNDFSVVSSGAGGHLKGVGGSRAQQEPVIDTLEGAGMKIFLVDFTDLEWKGDKCKYYLTLIYFVFVLHCQVYFLITHSLFSFLFIDFLSYFLAKCANNDKLETGLKCFVIEGTFNIFYTTIQNTESSSSSLSESINLIQMVQNVFQSELKNLPNELDSIKNIEFSSDKTTVDKNTPVNQFGGGSGNNSLSSSTKAFIAVGVVCSSLIVVAILIIRRGRNKSNNRQGTNYSQVGETTGMIPDRHIRSDDSVSNSPTMSSGARVAAGVAGGWDDAAHSEGSSRSGSASDTSSRPSFAVQLDEASQASHGIEASRSSLYNDSGYASTYLPSSVLKDLLDGSGRRKSFDALDTVDL